jgi:hypothetical protein
LVTWAPSRIVCSSNRSPSNSLNIVVVVAVVVVLVVIVVTIWFTNVEKQRTHKFEKRLNETYCETFLNGSKMFWSSFLLEQNAFNCAFCGEFEASLEITHYTYSACWEHLRHLARRNAFRSIYSWNDVKCLVFPKRLSDFQVRK